MLACHSVKMWTFHLIMLISDGRLQNAKCYPSTDIYPSIKIPRRILPVISSYWLNHLACVELMFLLGLYFGRRENLNLDIAFHFTFSEL